MLRESLSSDAKGRGWECGSPGSFLAPRCVTQNALLQGGCKGTGCKECLLAPGASRHIFIWPRNISRPHYALCARRTGPRACRGATRTSSPAELLPGALCWLLCSTAVPGTMDLHDGGCFGGGRMNAVIWPKSTAGDDAWPECSSSLPPSWEGSSAGGDTLKPGAGAPLSWRPTSRDPARPLASGWSP